MILDEKQWGQQLVTLYGQWTGYNVQFNLRFQQATNQLEKTSRVREVRRSIARIRTVLREKASEG